ncbi:MAG: RsmB/NOP family class I SAM-dependent RNA methyltransferase [Alphaproteobacteria bacterium]|nr:RsmB/NOP family class I SAM-dependent RNA methyltransferase [Alphaproteobacteria bacterium]
MKDEARLQTVIELADALFSFEQPADNTLNAYFRAHRYIGSRDRRFIADLVWLVLRHYGRLSSLTSEKPTGRMAVAALSFYLNKELLPLFNGEKYAPVPLSEKEKAWLAALPAEMPPACLECPDWLKDGLDKADIEAMTFPASTDLRVNTLKTERDTILKLLEKDGIKAEKTPFSPWGIRLAERINITAHSLFRDGLVEVQDEGSQLVSLLSRAQPGETVIDWCAGAGGKTLALSAMMQAKGTLYAADAFTKRLKDLPERANRAGAANIILLNDYKDLKSYDLVLVDAPCTGTGTWRRAPDARWRVTAEQSATIVKTQAEILDKAASHVKKGGRLFYITCSLDKAENENQAGAFLKRHADFEMQDLSPAFNRLTGHTAKTETIRLRPSELHTDGFFAASFKRK